MKKYLLVLSIAILHHFTQFDKGYCQTPINLGKSYDSADHWVKIQEYEKAKSALEEIIADPKSNSAQIFYSKLLLAQINNDNKKLNKALELYDSVYDDKDRDMPAIHVCRYLDLLRRNERITKAMEVVKRYHEALSLNDQFINIESSLNTYDKYSQNKAKGGFITVAVVKTPNTPENSYPYGIIPFGSNFLLLLNQYNPNEAQSFYINGKIILLNNNENEKKSADSLNNSFTNFAGLVQQGPATFFNNNKSVIFTANRYNKYNTGNRPYGSINTLQLYLAEQNKNGKWSNPKNISFHFIRRASDYSFMDPSMSEDGQTLYFASDMKGGFGGIDIYYTSYDEKRKKWGKPINMGNQINTNGNEIFPYIKNDTLLFSSNGLVGFGDQDIFMKRISVSDEPATHLPYPVNTEFKDTAPVFNPANNTFYFASDRPDQTSNKSEYAIEKIYQLVSSLPQLILNDGKQLTEEKINSKNNTSISSKTTPSLRDTMDVIRFDFDKYIIKQNSYTRLDSVYATYILNPTESIILIDGHTDVIGTQEYNMILSEKRAEVVMKYFMEKGVKKDVFKVRWFGFSRPLFSCNPLTDSDEKCQKVNTLNRRCEVYIKKTTDYLP